MDKPMEEVRNRDYRIDNIKAILMFLVVFGHMMEMFPADKAYRIIYSFHMPAFIFVTGYYAKFRPKKILYGLVMPYMIFQTLYLLFDGYIINISDNPVKFQYTTPYWLIWYLPTIIIYYVFLPVIQTDSKKKRAQILILSIIISLISGYDSSIGYYMSLSRTLVFLPFFVLGNYIGNAKEQCITLGFAPSTRGEYTTNNNRLRFAIPSQWHIKIICLSAAVVSACHISSSNISPQMLYGSYSYEGADFDVWTRSIILLIALIWILALFNFIPNNRLPIFSDLGRGTFSVFLMHGFCIKLIKKAELFSGSLSNNMLAAAIMSVLIVLAFGNKYFAKAFDYAFRGRMLENWMP